jgi:hypothetical protein
MTTLIWTCIGTVIASLTIVYLATRFAMWIAKVEIGMNHIYREVYGKDYDSFIAAAKAKDKKK